MVTVNYITLSPSFYYKDGSKEVLHWVLNNELRKLSECTPYSIYTADPLCIYTFSGENSASCGCIPEDAREECKGNERAAPFSSSRHTQARCSGVFSSVASSVCDSLGSISNVDVVEPYDCLAQCNGLHSAMSFFSSNLHTVAPTVLDVYHYIRSPLFIEAVKFRTVDNSRTVNVQRFIIQSFYKYTFLFYSLKLLLFFTGLSYHLSRTLLLGSGTRRRRRSFSRDLSCFPVCSALLLSSPQSYTPYCPACCCFPLCFGTAAGFVIGAFLNYFFYPYLNIQGFLDMWINAVSPPRNHTQILTRHSNTVLPVAFRQNHPSWPSRCSSLMCIIFTPSVDGVKKFVFHDDCILVKNTVGVWTLDRKVFISIIGIFCWYPLYPSLAFNGALTKEDLTNRGKFHQLSPESRWLAVTNTSRVNRKNSRVLSKLHDDGFKPLCSSMAPHHATYRESNDYHSSYTLNQNVGGSNGNHGDQYENNNMGDGSDQSLGDLNGGLPSSGGDGDDKGNSNRKNFSFLRRSKGQSNSNDQPVVVEFPVKHFWKIAKQQNDIESSEVGRCRGFYYRLLIHPKGTAGTDSEASHLSVFLEAVKQDWFPDDWVFPNVRFELTVVNFRDPKQNVTSWAHWSFSNDAASRGWQKMLSHSKLNRVSGFVDEEGTVLIRGKAEPPYDMLWSQAPRYSSKHLWTLIPSASNNTLMPPGYCSSSSSSCTQQNAPVQDAAPSSTITCSSTAQLSTPDAPDGECLKSLTSWNEIQVALQLCDQVVPALRIVLHADYVAYFVLILYFIREFRREIFLWNACNTYSFSTPNVSSTWNTSKKKDVDLKTRNDNPNGDTHTQIVPIIEALQSVFASLYLYPLVEATNRLSSSEFFSQQDVQLFGSQVDWWRHHLASASVVSDTVQTVLDDRLRQPSAKSVMCALCLADVQKMDVVDPLPYIHSTLFTMLHRQCQITYVSHVYKEALAHAKKQNDLYEYSEEELFNDSGGTEDKLEETCDAQELDHALRVLFSTVSSHSLRDPLSFGDYATSFVKVKHVHSMYRALEQSGRKFKRLPEVLFIYLTPQRNTKKGELFDVPLRLEMSHFLDTRDDDRQSPQGSSSKEYLNDDVRHLHVPCTTGGNSTKKDDKLKRKSTRDKQRRRLSRQKGGQAEWGPSVASDEHVEAQGLEASQVDVRDDHLDSSPRRSVDGETPAQPAIPDRWYCLYALIIREGDGPFGSVGVSQTSRTLLLRPEEDSPWYRIAQNRVERLVSSVDFSEWKCHRDFFCAAAVYIAEDYIDTVASGDIDLGGDLRDLNSTLYHKTLEKFGVTEEKIQGILRRQFKKFKTPKRQYDTQDIEHPSRIDYQASASYSAMFSACTAQGVSQALPTETFDKAQLDTSTQHMENKTMQETVLKFSPIGIRDNNVSSDDQGCLVSNGTSVNGETLAKSWTRYSKSLVHHDPTSMFMHKMRSATHPSFVVQHCRPFLVTPPSVSRNKQAFSLMPRSPLMLNTESCGTAYSSTLDSTNAQHFYTTIPWCIYRDDLELHHFLHQLRLADAIRSNDIKDIKRTLVYIIADRFTLCYYSSMFLASPFAGAQTKESKNKDPRNNRSPSKFHEARCRRSSMCDNDHWAYSVDQNKNSSSHKNPCNQDIRGTCARRSQSESRLSKNGAEWISMQLFNQLREPLEPCLTTITDLLLWIQKDVNICFFMHRRKYNISGSSYNPPRNDEGRGNEPQAHQIEQYVETWLQRLWSSVSQLVEKAEIFLLRTGLSERQCKNELLSDLWFHSPSELKRDAESSLFSESVLCDMRTPPENSMWLIKLSKSSNLFKSRLCSSEYLQQRSPSGISRTSDPNETVSQSRSHNVLFSSPIGLDPPSLVIPDIVCSAVASIIESYSSVDFHLLPQYNTERISGVSTLIPLSPPNPYKQHSSTEVPFLESSITQELPNQTKRRREEMDNSRTGPSGVVHKEERTQTVSFKPKLSSSWLTRKSPALPDRNDYDIQSTDVVINQQLAYLLDPEDFMAPANAKDFYQARIANFGTTIGPNPPLMPYLRNTSLVSLGRDSSSFKNLRGLDTLLGGVGLSAGFKQLVTAARYVRISITLEQDLLGLEGFGCEQSPPVTRVLTGYRGMSTGRLYGLLRLMLLRENDRKYCSSDLLGSTADNCRQDGDISGPTLTKLKLETSWRGSQKDSFMLYALVPDMDPSRKGRYRYVYMVADEIIDTYCDSKRRQVDPHAPDIFVLLVMCGHLDLVVPPNPNGAPLPGGRKARAAQTGHRHNSAIPEAIKLFPLPNDTHYPLFIFKWFDYISLDLICIGAQVCDSRKRLEDYVIDWLLPLLKSKGYHQFLPSVANTNSGIRYDISQYMIVEECHIRTCQNVRRFNAAIKKINKRTGDVIIVQLKHDLCSPSRMMERISAEIIAQCSMLYHPNDGTYAPWMFDLWKSYQTGLGVDCLACSDATTKKSNAYTTCNGLNILLAKSETFLGQKNEDHSALEDATDIINKINASAQDGESDSVVGLKYPDSMDGKQEIKSGSQQYPSVTSPPHAQEYHPPKVPCEQNQLYMRRCQKKKKKTKTNIPANTKSKIKAEVQSERRREVDRIQRKLATLELESCKVSSDDEVNSESHAPHDTITRDDSSHSPCSREKTSVLRVPQHAVPSTHVTEDRSELYLSQPNVLLDLSLGSSNVETQQEVVNLELSSTSQDGQSNTIDRKVEPEGKKHKEQGYEEFRDISKKVSQCDEVYPKQQQGIRSSTCLAHTESSSVKYYDSLKPHVRFREGSASNSSDAFSEKVLVGSGPQGNRDNAAAVEDLFKTAQPATTEDPVPDKTFSVAAEAVLGTFPDRFANIMRCHCLFTYNNQADVNHSSSTSMRESYTDGVTQDFSMNTPSISESVASTGLENLKVLLHPSSTVTTFVDHVIEAAIGEIQSVSLSVRLASAPCYGASGVTLLSSAIGRGELASETSQCRKGCGRERHARCHHGGNRVSLVALSTAYHIDRLFNDYLRDDKQHQQQIVCDFRRQLDTMIVNCVTRCNEEVYDGESDGGIETEGVLESEANLFERSLFARQLAALELFAAAFISSDLIGTRKGLHSLTLTLLGKTTCTTSLNAVYPAVVRQVLVGNRSLQTSLMSSESAPKVIQHLTALCSLCYLFFILGAKRVLQLADSQAGRRYFDNIITKLSDWLRRLSMVAFTEVYMQPSVKDKDVCAHQRRRHQYLLRHSYWALVLVLKDIVASRSPVTAKIVSRETEAALTLATLPFLSASPKSADNHIDSTSNSLHKLAQQKKNNQLGLPRISQDTMNTSSSTHSRSMTKNLKSTSKVSGAAPSGMRHTNFGRRKARWAALAQAFVPVPYDNATNANKLPKYEDQWVVNLPQDSTDAHWMKEHYGIKAFDKTEQLRDVSPDDRSTVRERKGSQDNIYLDISDVYDDDDMALDTKDNDETMDDEEDSLDELNDQEVVLRPTQEYFPRGWTSSCQSRSRSKKDKTLSSAAIRLRLDPSKYPDLRQFLDRRTGRPRVSKDKPCIVHESPTWFVTYKPAFWHCSGPSHCVNRPLDIQRLKKGDIEKALKHISLEDLQNSGKMESFHLWLMKQFPQQETIKRWTELECGLCHRIDLETSGAVLIARTRRTRDFLWDQFRRRNVHKEYLLLCHGKVKDRFGVVKTRLLTKDYDSRSRIKSHFTQVVQEGGEDSLTEYHLCRVYRRKKWSDIIQSLFETPSCVGEYVVASTPEFNTISTGDSYASHVLDVPKSNEKPKKQNATTELGVDGAARGFWGNCPSQRRSGKGQNEISHDPNGDRPTESVQHRMWIDPTLTGQMTEDEEFSLCKCRIVTGRTHQIRVHMRHIGHPLVSDSKYLEPKKCQEDRQWCPRMFLHAAVLEFSDPDSPNTFVEALCPLAHELVRALDTALVCVADYEPYAMAQYGIPPCSVVLPDAVHDNVTSATQVCDKRTRETVTKVLKSDIVDDILLNPRQEDDVVPQRIYEGYVESSFTDDVPLPPQIAPPSPTMRLRNTLHGSCSDPSLNSDDQESHDGFMPHGKDNLFYTHCMHHELDGDGMDDVSIVNAPHLNPPAVTPPSAQKSNSIRSCTISRIQRN